MLMRRVAVTSAMLIAAIGVTAGTVNAAPADNDVVYYKATTTDQNTVISTDAGSMVEEDGVFKIKAANGTTVAGTDLKFRVDDFVFPIEAKIDGRNATLTPQFVAEKAVYQPVALPYEDTAPWKTPYDREQAAWSRMTSTISMGATIGTLVGGIGGAAVGCILGGATLGAVTSALTAMFGLAAGVVAGCLAGFLAMGALGTLAGQLLVTAPVAILAAAQYFTTINQPFTPPAK